MVYYVPPATLALLALALLALALLALAAFLASLVSFAFLARSFFFISSIIMVSCK